MHINVHTVKLSLWGDKFNFAVRFKEIYQLLKLPAVSTMGYKFLTLLCKQVTWAKIDDKCMFFHTRLLPEDFREGSRPRFLVSILDDIISNIRYQSPIHRSTYPTEWEEKAPPTAFPTQLLAAPVKPNPFLRVIGRGLGHGMDGGANMGWNNKTWQERCDHLHSVIKQ